MAVVVMVAVMAVVLVMAAVTVPVAVAVAVVMVVMPVIRGSLSFLSSTPYTCVRSSHAPQCCSKQLPSPWASK